MIDFHSHILPGMDDGPETVEESLGMLSESWKQGVDLICSTSHFYADEEDPEEFLKRRRDAYLTLRRAMGYSRHYPEILLGAEVLYFPGISVAEEVKALALERVPFLLIEPTMMPWTDEMLDEIEQCGKTLECLPVIAHIDRYMRMLDDDTLMDRVLEREILIQANASFFLHRDTVDLAMESLKKDRIHFIGSDCHNLDDRKPNMKDAYKVIRKRGGEKAFRTMNERIYRYLRPGTDRN